MSKFTVNEKFFDHWNSEMAYVLGFIAADGFVKYGRVLGIKLSIRDKTYLQNIVNLMGSNNPVQERKYGSCHYCDVGISSKYIVSRLGELGITPRKSLTLQHCDVPPPFQGHFARGYFDGDGSIVIERDVKSPSAHLKVNLIGTLSFLTTLQTNFSMAFGEPIGCLSKNTKSQYSLAYHGTRSPLQFCEWIYEGSVDNTRLHRKFAKFEEYQREYGHLRERGRGHLSEQVYSAVLNWDIVNSIRKEYTQDGALQSDLAIKYNVTRAHISGIINNRYWVDSFYTPRLVNLKPGAILDWDKVREIRARRSCGEKQSALCREFGVSASAMSQLINGLTWKI